METFMYTFAINVDDKLLKTGQAIFSPVFQTTFNGVSFSWKLKFLSKTDKNKDRASLFLCAESKDIVNAKYQCVLITNEVKEIRLCYVSGMENFSANGRGWEEYSRFSFNGNIPKELKIYSDNCFKILCRIYIPHKCFNKPKPAENDQKVTECNEKFLLPKYLSETFFDQVIGNEPEDDLCDVILRSKDGQLFRCHKMILACSSDVFKTMFSSGFKIKADRTVKIEDIDGDTLTEVLRYIYKKEFGPNVDNLLESCLYAAEKYNLPELKLKCIAELKFSLKEDNVLHCLHLADKFSSDSLKMGCFEILRLLDHTIPEAKLKTFFKKHNFLYLDLIKFLYKRCDANFVV